MEDATKACPYCGETIQAAAIKCKYCGEWLAEKSAVRPSANPMAEVPPAAPAPTADDKDDKNDKNDGAYITKNVKIFLAVELVIALLLLLPSLNQHLNRITLRNALMAIIVMCQLFYTKTSRTGASLIVSILWALIGLGSDLDWGLAILFFLLSCAINYGIITVIMKKDGIRFKNAL
mgnify:CR=1 FL=1